jgi:hypothetical protein
MITIAEARKMIGVAPATPEQLLELQPPEPDPELGRRRARTHSIHH